MSILFDHHIIPQEFAGHDAFRGMDSEMFNIDSPGNRIYLPADREIAADMDLSRHPSRHVSTYTDAVEEVLDEIKKMEDPSARAAEIKTLIDAMRVGFANGDLHTNVGAGKTREDVDNGIKKVFADHKRYLAERPDQLQAVRDLEQKAAAAGQDHLIQWSAILGNTMRERMLSEAVAKNPGINVTAGNMNLGGTLWYSKFIAADRNPYLYPTPGSVPPKAEDFAPLPGFSSPSLDKLNQAEGFTRHNPAQTYGLPGFPVPDPTLGRFGQLPPSTAAPQDPLVLKFDPATGAPLPFSERSPILEPGDPVDGTPPDGFYTAAGLAALAAVAPELALLLGRWAIPSILSATAVPAFGASNASNAGSGSGGVFSMGTAPYDAFNASSSASNRNTSGGYPRGSPFGPPLIESTPLQQEPARANSFADRFGSWTETPAGTMPAQVSGVLAAPADGAARTVAPEDVRRLTRVNASNSANAFKSGTSPVPYLPSEFNDRFGNWSMPPDRQSSQASRPVGTFADEPSYSILPPIWGLEDPRVAQNDTEEWLSRWIRPLLR
ncbi:AHH domain-containing protein [Bradyrhizobium sp. UFLA05-153]